MKTGKRPTREESKRLYELAAELKDVAPWQWMKEGDIFGVENPETNQIGFVSVMGTLNEHVAIAVYLGAKGLYGFYDLQEGGLGIDPFELLEVPQLQVSFEDREYLERRDRDEIKRSGMKFRGAGNFPLFRSIGWGFMPWFITSDEARFLIHVIEQVLVVSPRVREDPSILMAEDDHGNELYLVRVADGQEGSLLWRDEMKRIREPEPEVIAADLPKETIELLKNFPQNNDLVFEIDVFRSPTPVLNDQKRPFVPKVLMMAESGEGLVLGVELFEPAEDTSKVLDSVSESLMNIWSQNEMRPREIRTGSDLVYGLLRSSAQKLNIELRQTNDLPAIDEACAEMFGEF